MSSSRVVSFCLLLVLLAIAAASASFAADKKQPPPPPAHPTSALPAVTDEYVHKEFGDNCSVLAGPPQFVGDLDGDGVDDLVIAARCKNPMADQAEYGFHVTDPYNSFLGFGNVKVTSTFASDCSRAKRRLSAGRSRRGPRGLAFRQTKTQVRPDQPALQNPHREKAGVEEEDSSSASIWKSREKAKQRLRSSFGMARNTTIRFSERTWSRFMCDDRPSTLLRADCRLSGL